MRTIKVIKIEYPLFFKASTFYSQLFITTHTHTHNTNERIYSKHPYTHHLDSTTVNILSYTPYHISTYLHPLIFN